MADFGLFIDITGKELVGMWGTPHYQSPEQLYDISTWDGKVDIFNIGVIFVEMVSGCHPFTYKANCMADVQDNIRQLKFKIPPLDPAAISFINRTICQPGM